MTILDQGLSTEEKRSVAEAIANRRRRYVLHLLQEAPESLTLMDVTREVVRWEQDPDETPDSETIESVHTSLHHIHVPKLEDAGLVEYNSTRTRIALSETASAASLDDPEE